MMTSSTLSTNDMWSKTIGYDPHANPDAAESADDALDRERKAERAKGVMELARLDAIDCVQNTYVKPDRCVLATFPRRACR